MNNAMRLCDAVIYFSKKLQGAEINDSTLVATMAIIVHVERTPILDLSSLKHLLGDCSEKSQLL
jgi:hypothetical protein